VADDYEKHGPARALLESHSADPPGSGLALRLMGAVHSLVLDGQAPHLATFYPSVGGVGAVSDAWHSFREVLAEQAEPLRLLLLRPVQTNDVGRSGSLMGGFLLVAQHCRQPLRILEVGASAGLNLLWDHYRYEWNGGSWGNVSSPIVLKNVFVNPPPAIPAETKVSERGGCDPNPLDPGTIQGQHILLSFTWADQVERIERLRSACAIASHQHVRIVKASAVEWLEKQLNHPAPGRATVVFHSVVWQYLATNEQAAVLHLIEEAGRRPTTDAPFAWLRMEPATEGGVGRPEIRLRIFADGTDRLIATSSYHTPAVRWLPGIELSHRWQRTDL
jgi:hypothetical protein